MALRDLDLRKSGPQLSLTGSAGRFLFAGVTLGGCSVSGWQAWAAHVALDVIART